MPWFSPHPSRRRARDAAGFTLLEILVTLAIMSLMLVAVLQYLQTLERVWKSSSADPFAEAQEAFESISQHLSSATLESYQDYADSSGAFRSGTGFVPDHLARRSDLTFVSGPSEGTSGLLTSTGRTTAGDSVFFVEPNGYTQTQAHTGLGHLLNLTGYFVEFGDDNATPDFISSGAHVWRWRLKQVQQPSESLQVYANTTSTAMVTQAMQSESATPVLAENVIALFVLPERSATDTGGPLATDYRYDSRDTTNALTLAQLPPRVRLVLVAIDSASAQRLAAQLGSQPPALIPAGLFTDATVITSDLAQLDASLTAQHLLHRIFQRDILLSAAAWSNTP